MSGEKEVALARSSGEASPKRRLLSSAQEDLGESIPERGNSSKKALRLEGA